MEKELAATLARELGHVFDEAVVARVSRVAHLVRPRETLGGGLALARALGPRAVPPSALVDPGRMRPPGGT